MKLNKKPIILTNASVSQKSQSWNYSSFFDVGNRVIYLPQGIHCIVIEKYFRRYKLQHAKYSAVQFEANEDQLRLYMPIDPPDYFDL